MTDKTDITEAVKQKIKGFSAFAKDESGAPPKPSLQMPDFVTQKAGLISAHFLLPAGSRIVDMGCESGETTYMLARLNPRVEVIGMDHDKHMVDFAGKTFKLPNLSFQAGDIANPDFEDESLDGIIDSNILHAVYSRGGYSDTDVADLLERQVAKLKIGGTILIRDYMMPGRDEYVLLELPDAPSRGRGFEDLSDADLLIQFSHTARPLHSGCEGFFLEELPARREKTRLFRLRHKWAVEFVHRKNYRRTWEKELSQEYTFFTHQDYRREFARLGMRMVYTAPYWNPWVIKNRFEGRFLMYSEEYTPLDWPATNYFVIAQKMAEGQSLLIEERRPSQEKPQDLHVTIVRDKKSGKLHEFVRRSEEFCDVVPYRLTVEGRLMIYVRDGYPRPIMNAVARGQANLDGKRWSGHLIEPVTMNTSGMGEHAVENKRMIVKFLERYAHLKALTAENVHVGNTYFPAPDRIDEAIEPVFVEVMTPDETSWSIESDAEAGFEGAGKMMELDAHDIMLSSQMGLLPDPRLELHVFDLMLRLGIEMPRWLGEKADILNGMPKKVTDVEDLLDDVEPVDFIEEKGGKPKSIKAVRSVFVEDGKVGRSIRGMASRDVEFILSDDGIENVALVLPLTRGWDNSLLVALDPQNLPVPQRMGGDPGILNAPSFVLPKTVKTIDDAKQFIANIFGVSKDRVSQLGQSYFSHLGVMPQRIYPFIVASEGKASGASWKYAPLKRIARLWNLKLSFSGSLLKALAQTHMMLGSTHDLAPERNMAGLKNKGFNLSTDKVDVGRAGALMQDSPGALPSRILGQRAAAVVPFAQAAPPETDPVAMQKKKGLLTMSYSKAKPDGKETVGEEEKKSGSTAVAASQASAVPPDAPKPK